MKLYWSKLFQDYESTNDIDRALETMTPEAAVAYVADVYDGYDTTEDEFTDYVPYCANNGTDIICGTYRGYTLLYNRTLGGVYCLYREATPDELDWWFNYGPGSLNN